MSELVLDVNALPSYLSNLLHAKKVRVREINKIVTNISADEIAPEKNYTCPFLGIAADSKLTVDKFLEWKREERDAEYKKELYS